MIVVSAMGKGGRKRGSQGKPVGGAKTESHVEREPAEASLLAVPELTRPETDATSSAEQSPASSDGPLPETQEAREPSRAPAVEPRAATPRKKRKRSSGRSSPTASISASQIFARNGRSLTLSGSLAAAIALFFWTQSRVPQLGEKAMMEGRAAISNLSFGDLITADPGAPIPQRILYTAINWANTNWRGMTFGVVFAAAFLTFLGFLPQKRSKNAWTNALKGVVVGVPLGLCVNCATPVGRGMHAAGLRSETALATLMSSPTLNPIVLTTLFAMFPLHMALTKVLLTLAFVLIAVPLISRRLLRADDNARAPEAGGIDALERSVFAPSSFVGRFYKKPEDVDTLGLPGATTWGRALRDVGVSLFANLLFIVRSTVPLMLIAGLLGAIVIELLPLSTFSGVPASPIVLLAAAIVGTFLPVPVAFDVLIVAALMKSGLPASIGMALLFTLGLFSVYPFLVIWRSMSRKAAIAIFAGVALTGTVAAHGVWIYEARAETNLRKDLAKPIGGVDPIKVAIDIAKKRCAETSDGESIRICKITFAQKRINDGDDVGLCELIADDAEQYAGCQRTAAFQAAVRGSRRFGDSRKCDDLPPKDRDNCRVAVAESLGGNDLARRLALCESVTDSETRHGCRKQATFDWIHGRGDASLCEYLEDSADNRECQNFARVEQVVLDRDPKGCSKLDAALQKECETRLEQLLMSEKFPNDDIETCQTMATRESAHECRLRWIEKRVKITGEDAHCDKYAGPGDGPPPPNFRPGCLALARVRRIEKEVTEVRMRDLIPADVARADAEGEVANAGKKAAAVTLEAFYEGNGVEVRSASRASRKAVAGPSFTRLEGPSVGLGLTYGPRVLDVKEPFAMGRGIASGDIDNDGWADIVVATPRGFDLYRNLGGTFRRETPNIPEAASLDAQVVALVDLDNDGWLDLFISGYGGTNVIVVNDRAGFSAARVVKVPSGGAIDTVAAAFGDVDGDGQLDLVLGNWSYGSEKAFLPEHSRNMLLRNRNLRFDALPLEEVPGETLSVLLSDLDGDGSLDLFVGNDYDRPDQYYFGDGRGHFTRVNRPDGIFDVTPIHTMSIETADFDNDLKLELFAADMSFSMTESSDYCAPIVDPILRARCVTATSFEVVVRNREVDACQKLDTEAQRAECRVMILVELAISGRDDSLCAQIPPSFATHRTWCQNHLSKSPVEPFKASEHIEQKTRNVLLTPTHGRKYVDKSHALGIDQSFWSWNARALDADDDGWQDLYIGNGYRASVIHPNVFFHNEGHGKPFVRREKEFGLDDMIDTPAYTAVDIDNDGDLDIIAVGNKAPLRVFRNEQAKNHTLDIALRDERGNRFGVGARIMVKDGHGQSQLRELKFGGGFLSFDAPVAHFGLGGQASAESVEVRWPNGETTKIEREFSADRLYVVTRKAP